MTTYEPLSVANEFIEKSGENGLTHMKLQKLVYLTLEEWLKSNDISMLSREPEVWQYGPVFSDMYQLLKINRSQPIKAPQSSYFGTPPKVAENPVLDCISKVWDAYKAVPATTLSDITHQVGGPWYTVASEHHFKVPFGTTIPLETIKKYVRREAQNMAR